MKTKQCVLLALLAAAVLLGAALWAMIRSNAKAEQAASAAAEGSIPLSSFAAEDLEQIEYTFNGETYTLQYSGGSWQLASMHSCRMVAVMVCAVISFIIVFPFLC